MWNFEINLIFLHIYLEIEIDNNSLCLSSIVLGNLKHRTDTYERKKCKCRVLFFQSFIPIVSSRGAFANCYNANICLRIGTIFNIKISNLVSMFERHCETRWSSLPHLLWTRVGTSPGGMEEGEAARLLLTMTLHIRLSF